MQRPTMSNLSNHAESAAGPDNRPPAGEIGMATKTIRRTVAPMHPGTVAADILEEQRISTRQAAAAIGMSHNGLQKVLNGVTPVTASTALRFGVYFGNGAQIWMNMQVAHDLWNAEQDIDGEL